MHFGSAHLLLFFVLAFLTSPEDMSEFRGILWGKKWGTTSGPQHLDHSPACVSTPARVTLTFDLLGQ